jgi:hypothetical protein
VYTFKVEARNSVGFSAASAELVILCGQPPDQIDPPVTYTSLPGVISVTWTKPWNGGSTITSYIIKFRTRSGESYTEETSICDGSQATTINNRICTI